jgi:hypothetical protein
MALAILALLSASAPAAALGDYRALIAADRTLSQAAKGRTVVEALAGILAPDAVLISGGATAPIRGVAAIRERLAADPQNRTASVEWTPLGGGISADGTHGYTYGGMTVRPRDGSPIAQKYLAYWVRRAEGWRVFAYKRAGRTGSEPLKAAPPVIGQGAPRRRAAATLKASEQAFSDEAQTIGLRAAFIRWGRAESINLGAADTIAVGAKAIGEGVAGPEPGSPVRWGADELLVAPSGDMGVTYGVLHLKTPSPGRPATIPFMTVWARPKPGDDWRYVAE